MFFVWASINGFDNPRGDLVNRRSRANPHGPSSEALGKVFGDHAMRGNVGADEPARLLRVVISESRISINAETLDRLRGKTLTLKKLDLSCDFSPHVFSKILVTA